MYIEVETEGGQVLAIVSGYCVSKMFIGLSKATDRLGCLFLQQTETCSEVLYQQVLEYDGTYVLDLESLFWGQLMLLVGGDSA